MSYIDLSNYTNLSKYGVYGRGVFTANCTSGDIIVNAGNWYGSSITVTGSGGLQPGASPPQGPNTTDSISAGNQLQNLDYDILNTITTSTNPVVDISTTTTGNSLTLYPTNIYKCISLDYAEFTNNDITFDGQGDDNAQFFIYSPTYITFTDVTFSYTGGATPCNIFWVARSVGTGAITVTDSSVPGVILTRAFTCTNDAAPDMILSGHIFSFGAITMTRSGDGALDVETLTCSNVVCYAKGTLILTSKGYVPIENIKVGRPVVTKGKIHDNKYIKRVNAKIEPVVWISKFTVEELNKKTRPVCIKQGALGDNVPFQDLYVSRDHNLLVNGKMIQAKYMINGETIYQDEECEEVEYYHLECEHHSAIIANGVLSESFLDINNRYLFNKSIKLHRKFNFKKMSSLV